MNIPLINTNDKESINTSLIAIKRATEELNNLIKIADEKMAQLDEKAKKYTDDKINALDVASVGGSGKYISAISETDGKISATASDITSTVSSGNSQPVTSGGVAETLNNPVIKTFSNNVSSNKIIHLGHFTIPSQFISRCGLNVEVEVKRVDGSYRLLGSIYNQSLKIGVYDVLGGLVDLLFYKTNDNNFDLYLFIGSWIEQVFVKMTEPQYFTYDGSVVTGFTGTRINPVYSNSTDSITNGSLQPITSGAVYTELLKYVRAVSNINPTITKNFTNFIDIVACDSTYGVEDIYNKMTNQSILFCYAQMLKNRPYPRDGFALLFRIDSNFGGAFYFANGGNIYYTYNDNRTWTAWRQI